MTQQKTWNSYLWDARRELRLLERRKSSWRMRWESGLRTLLVTCEVVQRRTVKWQNKRYDEWGHVRRGAIWEYLNLEASEGSSNVTGTFTFAHFNQYYFGEHNTDHVMKLSTLTQPWLGSEIGKYNCASPAHMLRKKHNVVLCNCVLIY